VRRGQVPVDRRRQAPAQGGAARRRLRWIYAGALYADLGATLDDLREAVTTLEDVERTSRRVLGGAHPLTTEFEQSLRNAQATLRIRETLPRSA